MHAIEQFTDGTSAFFSNREVPWHNLGIVTEGAQTAAEALRLAQLDWEVTKSDTPIQTPIPTADGVTTITVPNKFMTYRDHPKMGLQALGVVGNQYEVIQNSEAFDFLNHLVDESGAVFETAGSLNGGRQVFMSMRMPESVSLAGGQDTVDMYLMATTSHDGSKAFTAAVTPIRPVCANTVAMALASAQSTWYLRHTSNVKGKVAQAREALGLFWEYQTAFAETADALAAHKITDAEMDKFLQSLIREPKKDTDRRKANVERTRSEIKALMLAPTQENIKGTRWAAYNAVVEWADWAKPVRTKKGDADALRAERIMDGKMDRMKNRALALLSK